jgi:hypothetical protein
VTPDLLTRLTQELLDCTCSALEKTQCGCPDYAFVSAGVVAYDHCCDGGQLWVGIDRVFAYDRFPAPAGILNCTPPLAADIVIGILRCAPTLNDKGEAPSAETLTASSAQVYEDAYAVVQGVLCCLVPTQRERLFVMGNQRPLGPQGGCVGSELRLTVALVDPPPNCRDC